MAQIYLSIISNASDDDNPQSKLRSLMVIFSRGKRDKGCQEVSRLLMSGKLHQSTFE